MHRTNAAFRVALVSLLTLLFTALSAGAGTPETQDTTPQTQNRPATRRDVPAVRTDVPVIRREVPTVRRDAPATRSDVPAAHADPKPQDRPASRQGSPTSRVGQATTIPAVRACTREVPNLLNYELGTAGAVLAKSNLTLGDVRTVSSRTPKGTLIDQSPRAGSPVTCGTRVAVVVSDGVPVEPRQPPVSTEGNCYVPNLTNRLVAEVQQTLRGWTLGRVEKQENGSVPEGTIVRQSPSTRTYVKCGSAIDVQIAVAPRPTPPREEERCQVPDLTNRPVTDVQARLRGWPIGRVERAQVRGPQDGTILRQSPGAGASVKCGTPIDLVVATAPSPDRTPECRVPDLLGQHVRQASQTLAAAGLTAGTATRRLSTERVDTVIAQSTTRGMAVVCGSRIDVAIAMPLEAAPPSAPPVPPAPPALVRVPALQGQAPDAARRVLDDVGLSLGAVEQRSSEQQPVGAVVDQQPAAGTQVQRGTPVQVWVSAGVPLIKVPDLRGRDRAAAVDALGASQLRLGDVAERVVDAPAGTVVDQQPQAGTLARPGSTVRVWVAATMRVPSVIGRRETDAAAILANQRLRVGTTETRQSAEARGTVIEQRPQPGEQVRPNAAVDLVLASPITVAVPDLRGGNRLAAAVALTRVRLQLGEASDRESERPAGVVVEQSPRAGERVELGTPVEVWVAVPMRVEVPSVMGRQQPDAATVLGNGRLRIGSVEVRESAGARGAILEQRPQPGERVEVGSPVDLVLAAPIKVVVPDLRRSTRDGFATLLRTRGLVPGAIGERESGGLPGSILEQQPGAGTRVEPGTAVAIWIATPAPPVMIPPPVIAQLEVPDLTGRTRAEAEAMLAGRGLGLGQASTTTSNDTPDTVVGQQPAGGSRVPPGTGVNVVLAVAPVQSRQVEPAVPVTEPETSSLPLIWLLLGVAVGVVGTGVAVKARVHGSHALPPSVSLVPHPDPHIETALSSNGPMVRSELSLQPVPDAGHQTVYGSDVFGMIEVTEVR